jgi:hypothetical protein
VTTAKIRKKLEREVNEMIGSKGRRALFTSNDDIYDFDSIDWDDVVKKEARGAVDISDFGEVQETGPNYVLTQKGVFNKEKFHIPKYLVQGFDGSILWFNASKGELEGWLNNVSHEV